MPDTTITYRFEKLADQRDALIHWMDMLHYGMFSDALEIGPFNTNQFRSGIFVRGDFLDVTEFVEEFEAGVGNRKYKVTVSHTEADTESGV